MPIDAIPFWKLSGGGNDFVCLDNHDGRFDALLDDPVRLGRFVRALCRRRYGVGADGVMFADRPEIEELSDIAARFLEADGSECELCGNGTGCFARFAVLHGLVPEGEIRILTPAGVVRARRGEGRYVRVCIPSPESIQRDLHVCVTDRTFSCDYAVVGVPHLITYVDDLEAVEVDRWGRALRHHHDFHPRGVNVNFVQVLSEGKIAVRTYEFGVEAETLACGTGSAASAILTALRFGWDGPLRQCERPVLVRVRGGDELRIFFAVNPCDCVTDVCLETVVRVHLQGWLLPEFLAEALALG
ncbi:MAG: diaminopimelate epimerase [Phycisphaerae bacterium]|nr:diaminopimelate epimerase [Phycisphaerae bacterium]